MTLGCSLSMALNPSRQELIYCNTSIILLQYTKICFLLKMACSTCQLDVIWICLCHCSNPCLASQILTNSETEERKMTSGTALIVSEVLVRARKSPLHSHEPSSGSQLDQMGTSLAVQSLLSHCLEK